MTTKVTNLNIDASTITSVGTLTTLTVAGNVALGEISNIHITGGTNGQYIKTDGSGNLSFASGSESLSPFLLMGA